MTHKFKPERTNGGAYFCDCSCGWDAAVAAMRYEDGTPVEIISMTNPYRP